MQYNAMMRGGVLQRMHMLLLAKGKRRVCQLPSAGVQMREGGPHIRCAYFQHSASMCRRLHPGIRTAVVSPCQRLQEGEKCMHTVTGLAALHMQT